MRLVLPIAVPMCTAAILLLMPQPRVRRWVALCGSLVLLGCGVELFRYVQAAGIQVLHVGNWPAPFGISLVGDTLSAALVVAVGVVGVAVTGYGFAGVDPRREAGGYHALLLVLMMGVCGAFLTGDLFNLYVWFEVMLVASFVLMALHRTREQVQAALMYVTLNLIASTFLLTALGLLYGQSGSLNMADLSRQWALNGPPPLQLPLAMLFLTAFGVKAALFPWFFWLPLSYHAPPAAVGAVFAGLLTKVGVYSMIRVFTLLFRQVPPGVYTLILALSLVTMVVGVICALTQRDFRRVLAFNLVGHIGYTTMGLGIMTGAALAGSLLYVLHHIAAITNLYLVSGIFLRMRRTSDFGLLGSLYRDYPAVSLVAMVPIFALAGVPPLSGFVAKLAIVRAAFAAEAWWSGAIALIVGILSLLSMARLWEAGFWKDAPPDADKAGPIWPMMLPIIGLSLVTIGISVAAEPLTQFATRAAESLITPDAYITAVLGDGGN
jgi:multicomponent Na+:H+ antiporter subunit D